MAEIGTPVPSIQQLSKEQMEMLVRLLEAFTTGLRVIRFCIVLVGILGMCALAVQRIIIADRTYFDK